MTFLAINWNVDPVFFHIGALQVRWYGLLFISGFIIGWYIFRWFFRREGVKEELLDPVSLASERYISYMTQKDYPTLQFYKQITNQ